MLSLFLLCTYFHYFTQTIQIHFPTDILVWWQCQINSKLSLVVLVLLKCNFFFFPPQDVLTRTKTIPFIPRICVVPAVCYRINCSLMFPVRFHHSKTVCSKSHSGNKNNSSYQRQLVYFSTMFSGWVIQELLLLWRCMVNEVDHL